MDSRQLWLRIRHDYDQAKQRAPAGFEPFVQVFLIGRPDPVVPGFVETRRGDDETWIRLEAEITRPDGHEVADTDPIPSECYWVHAPESAIVGIEVSYRKIAGGAIGFAIAERDDDEPD
jgi:hypothetical protein